MSLSIGVRVGSYEVMGPLGAGGMGEVYRAHDTLLHRDVAIKVLPDRFLDDPERTARLKREAHLLASLNHPHIATIYGFESWIPPGGSDNRRLQLLILELVDGESLASRLVAGPLRIGQAIDIARQIADALEDAHDKGIVHRDLKAANVMLSVDGREKVLDFGLARHADSPADSDPANSTTITAAAATRAGAVLGTAAYMAPEQIKGSVADKRTDAWAFGCVLYEMLTGRRAFERESISETFAAILRDEPNLALLPTATPAAVRSLVHRCLQNERQARLRDMAVARYMLDEAVSEGAARPKTDWPAAGRGWLLVAVIAGLLAGALAMAPFVRGGRRSPAATIRFAVEADPLAGIPPSTGAAHRLALSADGQFLAFVGRPSPSEPVQIMVRSLDQMRAVPVAGTEDAQHPLLSPDGAWVAFVSPDGAWKKVARIGGTPAELWRGGGAPLGATWMDDNSIIIATVAAPRGLLRIPADGGAPTVVTTPTEAEREHLHPAALPGRNAVLFSVRLLQGGLSSSSVAVLDLKTGQRKTLIKDGRQATYVDSGHLVYALGGSLYAVRFDPDRLEVVGEPIEVMTAMQAMTGVTSFAVSANGTLAYRPGLAASDMRRALVWVDRQGREEDLLAPERPYILPHLSSNDSRLALITRNPGQDVWVWSFGNRTLIKLTSSTTNDLNPVWLPGDQDLLFSWNHPRAFNLFRMRADGAGKVEQITSGESHLFPTSVTADGRQAVVVEQPGQGGVQRLSAVDLQTGRVEPLLTGAFPAINAALSADNRWLAYQSNETGRHEIYVRPFHDIQSSRIPISRDGGIMPLWSRSRQELFYVDRKGDLVLVPFTTEPAFTAGAPTRVLEGRNYFFNEDAPTYAVSGDGTRFLMMKERAPATAAVVVVVNWRTELTRILP